MKKILDQIEDLSIESSFNLLTDFLKRVGAGILIGLGIAILFGWLSYKVPFLIHCSEGTSLYPMIQE